MTDFSTATAFGLVRRIAAAGQDNPAIYLLISETSAIDALQADLSAEVQVQLGIELRSLAASDIQPDKLEEAFAHAGVVLITLDRWTPYFIQSLDRNIVWVTNTGPVLLLATFDVAERALALAPNLRNRLTDVLVIRPDESFGDTPP
jgi:hypothetical protein